MRLEASAVLAGGLVLVAGVLSAPLAAQQPAVRAEAAVARSIENRMPVDTGSAFPADVGTLWFWTRVSGAEGQTISHVWRHGSKEWAVDLAVGGSPWRTYSSKVIPRDWTGEWRVEVRDERGRVLETVTVRVGGGG